MVNRIKENMIGNGQGLPFVTQDKLDATNANVNAANDKIGILQKKQKWIDIVEDYAADPTGSQDSTQKIANAVSFAQNNNLPLKIPSGVFLADVTFENIKVKGEGQERSHIKGKVTIGSNVSIDNVKMGDTGKVFTFKNNTDNSNLDKCYITGGDSGAIIYLNDSKVTNVTFFRCKIAGNVSGGNGVKIVDKGTNEKHYENIIFDRCLFEKNDRMNFECIQREDPNVNVVLGYRNINLIQCIFRPPTLSNTDSINVSYDSHLLTDGTKRSSGYSKIIDCQIDGGNYALEVAGAIEMIIKDNEIKNGTTFLLSFSQVANEYCNSIIANNKFIGAKDVVIQGSDNQVFGNTINTSGRLRFNPAKSNLVVGNKVICSGATAVSLEGASEMKFSGNHLYGGTSQTVLNIQATSLNNSFIGNWLYNTNVAFDTRDSTTLILAKNYYQTNGFYSLRDDVESVTSLPAAAAKYRGKQLFLQAATGVGDGLFICRRLSDGSTYEWKQLDL